MNDWIKKRGTARRDLVILILVMGAFFGIGVAIDLAELWHGWTQRYESWNIDEIELVFVIASAGFAWYALARWLDYRDQLGEAQRLNRKLEDEIAQRKRAEVSLRDSEQRFRDFTFASSDWFWEMGPDLRFTFVSEHSERILGVSPERFIGRTREEVAGADPSEEPWATHLAHIEVRRPFRNFEYEVKGDDGERVCFSSSGVPVYDDDGAFKGYRGTGKDVTEQKLAEEALRSSEARLAAILDIAPEGIISIDGAQNIRLFNQGAEAIFGYRSEEVLGQPLDLLLPERFRQVHGKHVERFMGVSDKFRQMSERISISALRRDGSEFPAQASITKFNQAGETIMTIMLQDVTENRKAEQALIDAKEDAELANRAKSEFLANMSHELRTPLNAIIGFAEIIGDEKLGEIGRAEYRDYAKEIDHAGRHLLGLISDILDLSKIEAGKLQLREMFVDVREVTRSSLAMLRERALRDGVYLDLAIPEDLPSLLADERMLKQILINLLSNAVKFTPAGGTVTLEADCPSEAGYVVRVRDTGIGMAPEDIPKALSRFVQLDSQLTRKHEGTGLGLPLCRSLAELHGGSLEIESQLGSGTTVTVSFPAKRIGRNPKKDISFEPPDRAAV
jgi:PAS domain S-box-containing protein